MVGGLGETDSEASVCSIEIDTDPAKKYKTDGFEGSDSKEREMLAAFSYTNSTGYLEFVYGISVFFGNYSLVKMKLNDPDKEFLDLVDLDNSIEYGFYAKSKGPSLN